MNFDDSYVSKKECVSQGFVKNKGLVYKMSILEKYLKKGWLEFGDSRFSGKDRYKAALKFYSDYRKGHVAGLVSSSWKTEKIDCAQKSESEGVFYVRNRYFSAVKSLPVEFWEVVRKVCIEDKDLTAGEFVSERRRLEMTFALKRDLCRGLDRLIEFYYGNKIGS